MKTWTYFNQTISRNQYGYYTVTLDHNNQCHGMFMADTLKGIKETIKSWRSDLLAGV